MVVTKLKIEGYSHTELCPHGSGDRLEDMVKKAIQMGFTDYYVTEHAPLPHGFVAKFWGVEDDWQMASLIYEQVESYFNLVDQVQAKYQDQIKLHVGFEVDYVEGFEAEIRQFLDTYGPRTDQNILSVHYLRGADGMIYGVDYSPEELQMGFTDLKNQPHAFYQRYLRVIKQAIATDLGIYQPQRLGHLTIMRKYQDYFALPQDYNEQEWRLIKNILILLKDQGRQLNFNLAGMYKEYCNDFYLGARIAKLAKELGVSMAYGSDAHSIKEVGHGYHLYEAFK